MASETNLWTIDDSNVGTYGTGNTAGVSLSSGQVTWQAAKVNNDLVKLSGVKDLTAANDTDTTVSLTADNFSGDTISVTKSNDYITSAAKPSRATAMILKLRATE